MKTITVPTRASRRMKSMIVTEREIYTIASAVGNPYTMDLPDDTEAILYMACDNSDTTIGAWLWKNGVWGVLDLKDLEKVANDLVASKAPKAPEAPKAPKPSIDPKLYKAAEDYAREFDRRQKAVEKAAKKVLK